MRRFLLKSLNYPQSGYACLQAVLIAAVFILFPLGQLTRWYPITGGALYLHELPLGLAALLYLGKTVQHTKLPFYSTLKKSDWLTVITICWILFGVLAASILQFSIIPWFYLSRLLTYLAFLLVLRDNFIHQPTRLLSWLMASGLWYWWLALLQYLVLPDVRFLWLMGWDDHYYRMVGTLFDPGLTGSLLVLTGLVIYQLRHELRQWCLPLLLLVWGSTVLTFSRATYLTLAVVLALLCWSHLASSRTQKFSIVTTLQRWWRWIGVAVIGVILLHLLIPRPGGEGINLLRTSTIQARLTSGMTAVKTMEPIDWFIGQGLFTPSTTIHSTTTAAVPTKAVIPDNIFITLLTQTGLLGFGLICWWSGRWLLTHWHRYPVACWAVVATLIASQFNNILLHPYSILYLGGVVLSSYLRVTLRSDST